MFFKKEILTGFFVAFLISAGSVAHAAKIQSPQVDPQSCYTSLSHGEEMTSVFPTSECHFTGADHKTFTCQGGAKYKIYHKGDKIQPSMGKKQVCTLPPGKVSVRNTAFWADAA